MSNQNKPKAPAAAPPEGIAHRLPDKMAERLAVLGAERDRRQAALRETQLAIGESIGGFLMARGQDLDAIDWQLSDDGRAVMVRPKKPT